MESNRLRRIKLRHLLAFVETLRGGSLKAAADRIGLSQSAVSKTIRDLEVILGLTLMHRDRGGIALTPEGEVFRRFAEQGLTSIGHGLANLDARASGRSSPLRIGALPSVAADLLPDAVVQFQRLSPATPIRVEDGALAAMIDRLRAGDLDLVIGRMGRPETMAGLSFTQLYSEQVVFAAARGHPRGAETDIAALSGECVLYPPPGSAIRPLVDRLFISHGVGDWPGRIETVSGAFGRGMTLGPAQAIWIISRGVIARDIAAGRMTVLPIDSAPISGPVGIMARAEESPSPAMQLFRQVVLAVVGAARPAMLHGAAEGDG